MEEINGVVSVELDAMAMAGYLTLAAADKIVKDST